MADKETGEEHSLKIPEGGEAFVNIKKDPTCGDSIQYEKPSEIPEESKKAVKRSGGEETQYMSYAEREEFSLQDDENSSSVPTDDESSNMLPDSSFLTGDDPYISRGYLQDLLARLSSDESQSKKHLTPELVELYQGHIENVYGLFQKYLDALLTTVNNCTKDLKERLGELSFVGKFQVILFLDTLDIAYKQLRRSVMSATVSILKDIEDTSKTVAEEMEEQYLFCQVVSLYLVIRDSWWRSEMYNAKYFVRTLNRCQDLSDEWQSKLQVANVNVLRATVEIHQFLDREIALGDFPRRLNFQDKKPIMHQPNIANIFVEEQLAGDISTLMTLFIFELGNPVYNAIFEINKHFQKTQLMYDCKKIEDVIRTTWVKFLDNVQDQCTELGGSKAMYCSLDADEPSGNGTRFYSQVIEPYHTNLVEEWAQTYSAIEKELEKSLASAEHPVDLQDVAAQVKKVGDAVQVEMNTAFQEFKTRVEMITQKTEVFSGVIKMILE